LARLEIILLNATLTLFLLLTLFLCRNEEEILVITYFCLQVFGTETSKSWHRVSKGQLSGSCRY